jgi:hypothetical protein
MYVPLAAGRLVASAIAVTVPNDNFGASVKDHIEPPQVKHLEKCCDVLFRGRTGNHTAGCPWHTRGTFVTLFKLFHGVLLLAIPTCRY